MIHLANEWNEIKPKLKRKFQILIDSDLTFKEGKYEEMLDKLQAILGRSREELLQIIRTLT